ncbi:FG-GAP repeat protein [Nocardiopsis potens]|uniref:FG-GAP repeat protein n=1 Tax=Nocardiopsis potens TaxID=1246458 RepID=UPI000344CB34|nr:FG-GAP repeat protein [Nocardiopsis potens]
MPDRRRTLIAVASASAAVLLLCSFCGGPVDPASTGCGAALPTAPPIERAAEPPDEEEPSGPGAEEGGVRGNANGDGEDDRADVAGDVNGDGEDDLVVFPVLEDTRGPAEVRLSGAEGEEAVQSLDPVIADSGAVADIDGDGYGDLVLNRTGSSAEDSDGEPGRLTVLFGGPDGLDGGPVGELTLDSPGVPRDSAEGDRFGRELAAGDVDGDGRDEVAASVHRPVWERRLPLNKGDVILLRGGPEGLTGEGAVLLCPESAGADPYPEKGDSDPGSYENFGYEPSWSWPLMDDVDGDGDAELLVAAVPDQGRQRAGDPWWGFDLSGGEAAALPPSSLPGGG